MCLAALGKDISTRRSTQALTWRRRARCAAEPHPACLPDLPRSPLMRALPEYVRLTRTAPCSPHGMCMAHCYPLLTVLTPSVPLVWPHRVTHTALRAHTRATSRLAVELTITTDEPACCFTETGRRRSVDRSVEFVVFSQARRGAKVALVISARAGGPAHNGSARPLLRELTKDSCGGCTVVGRTLML